MSIFGSYGSQQGGKKIWVLALIPVALLTGWVGYRYIPPLYYQFTGDAIIRIQKRSESYQDYLRAGNRSIADLYRHIDESRRFIELIGREGSDSADLYYYRGLFLLYEMLLRTELNGATLLKLTGRGFLPPEKNGPDIPDASLIRIARDTAVGMRKALAIDPEPAPERLSVSLLGIVLGDLIATGRMDGALFSKMERIHSEDLPVPLRSCELWTRLALFALQGKRVEAEQYIERFKKEDPKIYGALFQSETQANLYFSHLHFVTASYISSLNYARMVKANPEASDALRAEAIRMEGEIFLIQRGAQVASIFFRQALDLSPDPYIEERLSAVGKESR